MSTEEQNNKPRPFVDLIISIAIPSIILMKFSGEEDLGPTWALIAALAFPIGYGIYELAFNKKRNLMALLGVVSVLLTGGIGLLKIDAQWLAVKEAAIPLCIGIGVLVANKLGYPLIRKLLFNPTLMNVDRIHEELDKNNSRDALQHSARSGEHFTGRNVSFQRCDELFPGKAYRQKRKRIVSIQ